MDCAESVVTGLDAKPTASAGHSIHDRMPYVSLPIAYTQPARLGALVQLFGLPAPEAGHARVLELGCASGGNLIPLAAHHPNARFVGIDLSRRQVSDAQRRTAALGLNNIEVLQGDLATLSLGNQQFDYIICHGVFSWVPETVRLAILKICSQYLSDTGIAAISYNVLPGWHLRRVVRDLCQLHAGDGDPATRAARIRRLMQHLAEASSDDPYGMLLRAEARRLAGKPASYIVGEFLADCNDPLHFRDFVALAEGHGLRYICEGDAPSSCIDMVAPKALSAIRTEAGRDWMTAQALADAFSGRTFRRSILTRKSGRRASVRPTVTALRNLHFTGRNRGDSENADMHHRVLTALGRTYPGSSSFKDLLNVLDVQPPQLDRILLNLVVKGHVTIATTSLAVGTSMDRQPLGWSLARSEAATAQPWVTNLRHTPVILAPDARQLLSLLDGRSERSALADDTTSAADIDSLIKHLANNALLAQN